MLLVGDLHLTSQPRDSYRWQIFAQIKKAVEANGDDELVLLGDLSDRKDNHASELVNRICDQLTHVAKAVKALHILRGNHDGIDPAWPYFHFLRHIPKIRFYSVPTVGKIDGHSVLFLPHSRNAEEEWRALNFKSPDIIFAHVTVDGATAENKQKLIGISAETFCGTPVYAGDVHVPQRVGCVTYVGAPYPIRFGDSFDGRFVHLDSKLKAKSIVTNSIRRLLLDVPSASALHPTDVRKHDQAKVRVHLKRADLHAWSDERKAVAAWASGAGVELVAVELVCEEERKEARRLRTVKHSVDDLLNAYVRRNNVDNALSEVGRNLLHGANK